MELTFSYIVYQDKTSGSSTKNNNNNWNMNNELASHSTILRFFLLFVLTFQKGTFCHVQIAEKEKVRLWHSGNRSVYIIIMTFPYIVGIHIHYLTLHILGFFYCSR